MKCLKVDEYVKRTACPKDTDALCGELQEYVNKGPGPEGRTLCDRVIRACNHQLGTAPLDGGHLSKLVELVELAVHGYEAAGQPGMQSTPFYVEKILFHIVKKLATQGAHQLCQQLGALMYNRLASAAEMEDYHLLVRNCFAVLWNAPVKTAHQRLGCHMQALSFLLLLDGDPSQPCTPSKVPAYTEDAVAKFERGCKMLTVDDADCLLQETQCFLRPRAGSGYRSRVALCEAALHICKCLCKAGLWDRAAGQVEWAVSWAEESPSLRLVLGLARQAVGIHHLLRSGEQCREALSECVLSLRALPASLGYQECHVVLQGCQLVTWALETGPCKALGGTSLLAWFSFLKEYQELLLRQMHATEEPKEQKLFLQKTLCYSLYQGFTNACDSLMEAQLEDCETLSKVLLYCKATAARMMSELQKLTTENTFTKAATAVNNLVCGLYNRKLYDQAFSLAEILCQQLIKNSHPSFPVNKLNRAFMLAVQSSRRGGQLEHALDWVVHWMRALGNRLVDHMAEPVSLWVKIKGDAARGGQEDVRLRTLRDGFGPDAPAEGVMLRLLEEELRAYREVVGDTAQERYNTLCDLLDICHEGSAHTQSRAVYLCEMAQVVCFQDFSQQTDCTAVDFAQEALRLLEEEPETAENGDQLKDHKAQASLWLYICTMERNLKEAIQRDRRLCEAHRQVRSYAEPLGTNDLDYEDKQKQQDSQLVYDCLHFSLRAESRQCQPLQRSLELWRSLLSRGTVPAVRRAKQTVSSIVLMGGLFRLMGKPLQALESYQLATGLSRGLGDTHSCATSMCHVVRLLLDVGAPELAQLQLEQVEKLLPSVDSDGLSPLSVLARLLKAQLCYSTAQVEMGVSLLDQVMKEVTERKHSKSWYLLQAMALQTASAYLGLDVSTLPCYLRQKITQHGLKTADTALYESLKLLCSLLVTLVGNGFYGAHSNGADTHFVDQGDSVFLKWQLLSEVLSCSLRMVAVRSHSGAVPEAKAQCLEALKLATKLQTISQCSELLVVKAELELQRGERDLSGMDLQKVKDLLDLGTEFISKEGKAEVKIKLRKGCPTKKLVPPELTQEEDYRSILSTAAFPLEPVDTVKEWALTASPKLKTKPQNWLSSLAHKADCDCPCCSDPRLGRVVVRWAAAQAELAHQLEQEGGERQSSKLFLAALSRCKTLTAKLGFKLASLMLENDIPTKEVPSPSFVHDLVGKIYLHMSLTSLELHLEKTEGTWELLESGLTFMASQRSPELVPLRAHLQTTKALASILALAANKDCRTAELFSAAWSWNLASKCETKPKRLRSTKTIKQPGEILVIEDTKKCKDPAASLTVPKVKITFPSTKSKHSKKKPVIKSSKLKSAAVEVQCGFDFDDEVPQISVRTHSPGAVCTPNQKLKGAPRARRGEAKPRSKLHFQVYDESSPVQNKPGPVPAAPKRSKRSRFKVEFSDESDAETSTQEAPGAIWPLSKTSCASKATSEKKKTGRTKKSTALPSPSSSSVEEDVSSYASLRRGRTKKQSMPSTAARGVSTSKEEPERLRAIKEDMDPSMDISVEKLRVSDLVEEEKDGRPQNVPDTDFEVLRRDLWVHQEMEHLGELGRADHTGTQPFPTVYPSTGPDGLSLDSVRCLLLSAWLSLQHFPPPRLYPQLCGLLALCHGQSDPVTTAMLHSESLGVTIRHHMTRHLAGRLAKLRKAAAQDLADKLGSLSLDGPSTQPHLQQRLSQLERIFSFLTLKPEAFPHQHGQEFTRQLENIPSGMTVCLLSVVGEQPSAMGDTILLSRLESGALPITVRIPTTQSECPISRIVQEMEGVQKQQKMVSNVADKAQWWEGRRALDQRMERLLEDMRETLGCWQGLLLPVSSDPRLGSYARNLHQTLTECGARTTEELLKAILSAAPLLSQQDMCSLAEGLCPGRSEESLAVLQKAASALKDIAEPQGHIVLVLDKYLQKLPWESISCLRSRSVTRMPSLHFLLGHAALKQLDPGSVLNHGVDPQQVFYVLNPDANLKDTEERFKEWFTNEPVWQGVCGTAPSPEQLQEAVTTKDLYIYVGHGAGARFLDGQKLLKGELHAASLLFGCSSAALAVHGEIEGAGVILNYLMAGCPLILGNLWDVTDRDIDRFTKALLQSWLSAGHGAPLLNHMASSRQATYLKHLIGAAPVVYGLPIFLR
ncbi:separin [Megalops cyprinoides]|uniref:separin n=1 Tax=Megalops cyprinoides TaxID=118141 RepID=UPI0018651018|nr:separin [Megalops cyprinoides]